MSPARLTPIPPDPVPLASIRDSDEFWQGVWWIPNGKGGLRTATPGEATAEIIRLRERVARLEAGQP